MVQTTSRLANLLLRTLPEEAYSRLAPHLSLVSLPPGTVLYQPFERIQTAYFPESSVVSLVHVLENGATCETGIVGFHGMLGFPILLGSGCTNQRVTVQIAGSMYKIPAHVLKYEFDRGGELQRVLLRYAEARLRQISQQVACNAYHSLLERLARWLLSVQDLTHSNELFLTQEVISQMLGVRRSGVTVTAKRLQNAGIIDYKRGRIVILDQEALEQISCECYCDLKAEFSRLLNFDSSSISSPFPTYHSSRGSFIP